jgi:phosphohistidine phosphatase SixA
MKLYLMRHCLTDDGAQMDRERGLNEIGKEQAKVMRKFLKLAGLEPDVIVCSNFKRAEETADRIDGRGDIPVKTTARLEPDRNVAEAWEAIKLLAGDANRVLVVTHSPLVQQLLASVAFNFRDELWEFHHGAIAYINTDESRFRWYVNPKLAAHLVGEDPEEVENPIGEGYNPTNAWPMVLPHLRKFAENLMADTRRGTIEPLRDQMRTAVVKRWRKQLRNVRRALKTHTATDYVTAAAVVATAIPFTDKGFINAHSKVQSEAYEAGVEHASAQLGLEMPASIPTVEQAARPVEASRRRSQATYIQNAGDLEGELDATTVDRAHNTLKALEPFTLSAATAALGSLFAGFTDPGSDKMSRGDTIALDVVSNAYHAGASDTAEQAAANGADVEKAWVTEDDPCETCIANEAEGYIPQDAPHDSGDFEPPAHPNCQCSEVYRLAGEG